jgi:hypothetical protein
VIRDVALLGLALAALAAMVAFQRAHVRRVGGERRALLEGVRSLFEEARVSQEGIGYPCLTATHAGYPVRVDLVADSAAMRQLPRLWLVVSLLRPVDVAAPVDILLRPQPSDIVSPGERFAYEHVAPPGWPDHLRIATPGPDAPDLRPSDTLLALLREPETKDVLAGPGGVRIVQELARADLGQWRLVRRAKFVVQPPRARLASLLDAAHAIAGHLDRTAINA